MKLRGSEFEIEPERYELLDGPAYKFDLERRDFFRVLGAGILVLIPGAGDAQESGGTVQRDRNSVPEDVGAWIHVDPDGIVRVFTGKAEVGQNIRTSLSQVVAEELRTPVDRIRLVMADTALTPFDAGTFGSRTTPVMAPQLRLAAATAREALLEFWPRSASNPNEVRCRSKRAVLSTLAASGRFLSGNCPEGRNSSGRFRATWRRHHLTTGR
jgi:isoquinoline 1-oxidoreductase